MLELIASMLYWKSNNAASLALVSIVFEVTQKKHIDNTGLSNINVTISHSNLHIGQGNIPCKQVS